MNDCRALMTTAVTVVPSFAACASAASHMSSDTRIARIGVGTSHRVDFVLFAVGMRFDPCKRTFKVRREGRPFVAGKAFDPHMGLGADGDHLVGNRRGCHASSIYTHLGWCLYR